MQDTKAPGLIGLFQENMVLRAEIATLVEILRISELTERLPEDWLSRLKQARHTESYQNIAKAYDRQLAKLDRATSRGEIDEVLQDIPLMILNE